MPDTQYMSQEKIDSLQVELKELKEIKAPKLRKRIDEARQMGDLSENAEYHTAREELVWIQSRIGEINAILYNAEVIADNISKGIVSIGSTIVVKVNGQKKEYTIVGAQEANPLEGKISNESPLGSAFLGKAEGNKIDIQVPAGIQEYKIIKIK